MGFETQENKKPLEVELLNSLIEHYHYLGYCHPVGEQIKYLVSSRGRPVACFTLSSAPRHLGPRDRFIGWTAEQRKANIRLLAEIEDLKHDHSEDR